MIQIGAALAAALCIAAAAWLQKPINDQRQELQLVQHSNLYRDLPPEYAWISAIGSTFRGLAVNILWMRAEDMKQEGKYYESHQLAKWICTLQPRFPAVWVYQAWNMSYNISVATYTPQQRWQWVYNGIRLLRDQGIPNNPRSAKLYREIGWIWFHKVGKRTDNYHLSYKRQWAGMMENLLGAPPTGVGNAEEIDWFRPIAKAPQELKTLIEKRPGVANLVEQLDDLDIDVQATTDNQKLYHPLEETFFKPLTQYRLDQQTKELRDNAEPVEAPLQKMFDFFEAAKGEDFEALLAWMRAKVLREQYKMDPQYMLEMTGKMGTDEPIALDWRNPFTHAMYWAMYGMEKVESRKNVKAFDILNTDRVVLYSLIDLAQLGQIVFRIDPDNYMNSYLDEMPDTRFVEAMHKKYLEYGKKHAEERETKAKEGVITAEILRSGHVNSLEKAIVDLYCEGKIDEARHYLRYLAANYKSMITGRTEERYVLPLDEFVQQQFVEMIEMHASANSIIHSLLNQSYIALAQGRDQQRNRSLQTAQTLHDKFKQLQKGDTYGRYNLPPFEQMQAAALTAFTLSPGYPIPMRSTVWRAEKETVKQKAYDFIAPRLQPQCDAMGYDFNKAFPTPIGMKEYRDKPIEERLAQPDDTRKEIEKKAGPDALRETPTGEETPE